MKSIVQDGNPTLRKRALAIPEKLFGSVELLRLIEEMSAALDQEPDGVALAAPQIGVSKRLFIIRSDRTLPPPPKDAPPHKPCVDVYANPEIIRRSRKKQEVDEGCLSVRGVYGMIKRHERATVRARDVKGKRFERGAGGLLAQIFEHEIDHLDGVLFIDHATKLVTLPPPHEQGLA